MMNFNIAMLVGCVVYCVCGVLGNPKYSSTRDGGYQPSVRYYESDILTFDKPYNNKTSSKRHSEAEPKKDSTGKESRFGIISYGGPSGGPGYGDNGVAYGPSKVDMSGVVLGVFIGLAGVLIIPKIINLLGGVGGYGRSLDDNEISPITNFLSRIDNSLAANNIDSTTCGQRIICTFVSDANKNRKSGESSSIDEFIYGFTSNPLLAYVLDGTSIKEAIEVGKKQDIDECSTKFSKCPLSKDNVLKVISSLIPN